MSGGLHGVGSSVVNALSSRLDVEVRQKGHAFRMSFERGVPVAPLAKQEPTDETGTTVTYWASEEVFDTTDYDFETIRARFQQMAFLNKGLRINLVDERIDPADVVEADEDVYKRQAQRWRPGHRHPAAAPVRRPSRRLRASGRRRARRPR